MLRDRVSRLLGSYIKHNEIHRAGSPGSDASEVSRGLERAHRLVESRPIWEPQLRSNLPGPPSAFLRREPRRISSGTLPCSFWPSVFARQDPVGSDDVIFARLEVEYAEIGVVQSAAEIE